jgi:hypothetical protein
MLHVQYIYFAIFCRKKGGLQRSPHQLLLLFGVGISSTLPVMCVVKEVITSGWQDKDFLLFCMLVVLLGSTLYIIIIGWLDYGD